MKKNDDLFSRRLSDSNRRTSLTPIPQISIITTSSSVVKTQGEKGPKANNTPSSSFPSTSSSSQSYRAPSSNTASARLKARLHADDPKSKPRDSSTSYHARVCNLLSSLIAPFTTFVAIRDFSPDSNHDRKGLSLVSLSRQVNCVSDEGTS